MIDASAIAFLNKDEFYRTRGGERSGEQDFGVFWNDGPRWPIYRVAVVHQTGDVYAEGSQGDVLLLGNVGTNRLAMHLFSYGRSSETCTAGCAYAKAEKVLNNWTDMIHRPKSLDWIRGTLGIYDTIRDLVR